MSASTLERQTIPDTLIYEMVDGQPIIEDVKINIQQLIDQAPCQK